MPVLAQSECKDGAACRSARLVDESACWIRWPAMACKHLLACALAERTAMSAGIVTVDAIAAEEFADWLVWMRWMRTVEIEYWTRSASFSAGMELAAVLKCCCWVRIDHGYKSVRCRAKPVLSSATSGFTYSDYPGSLCAHGTYAIRVVHY